MTRPDVVRELEAIERELELYENKLIALLWQIHMERSVVDCHIPAGLEERLRELRLKLDRDELLGAEWGAIQ
jgi:hypothetical protein